MKHTAKRLHQPRKATLDYCHPFEQWVGYKLHPHARRVITAIERQRALGRKQRIIVREPVDNPSGLHRTLADYIRWRATVVFPGIPFFASAPSMRELRDMFPRQKLRRLPDRKWQPILFSQRRPNNARGVNFRLAMLTGVDLSFRRRPFVRLLRLLATVVPIVGDGDDTLFIITGYLPPGAKATHKNRWHPPYPEINLSDPDPPDGGDEEGVHFPAYVYRDMANTVPRRWLCRVRRDIFNLIRMYPYDDSVPLY
ncbi:MAG: hypothetical protein NC045_01835 [Bacteroides sp.]|nr:hypothetical protein [Bacteroides sp.]